MDRGDLAGDDRPEDARTQDVDLPVPSVDDGPYLHAPGTGSTQAEQFVPPHNGVWVPSGKKGRAEANLAALEVLRELRSHRNAPTPSQQQVLAGWSSWGAVPEIFESHREDWRDLHTRLRGLLNEQEWNAARATTMNAHYTDPAVAQTMWEFLELSNGGQSPTGPVLEPGCGVGTFMLGAPSTVNMVGVELDPVTAEIAAHLNPGAHIRNEGFERTRFNSDEPSFTATMGNVPFGAFTLHDPADNPLGLTIHNHFLAKSIKHTAPGGYAVVLTSSYTMDAKRSTARRYLAEYADLVGAVRLPSGAMRRVAGTDVVTDVLILRRRPDGADPADMSWVDARHSIGTDANGDPVAVNKYWADNPGNVLGEHRIGSGMHGTATTLVAGPLGDEMLSAMRRQLHSIAIEAEERGLGFTPASTDAQLDARPGLYHPNPALEGLMPGHVRSVDAGFSAWDGTQWQSLKVAKNRAKETTALLAVRDALSQVITTQNDPSTSTDTRQQARARLNAAYDSYVTTYGPINRFQWSTPRKPSKARIEREVTRATTAWRRSLPADLSPDERAEAQPPQELVAEWIADVDAPAQTKVRRHLEPLRDDPAFGGLLALEVFDDDTQRAIKADIFTEDIVAAPTARTSAQTPRDAVAISLDETRTIDPARVAELLGVEPAEVNALIEPFTFNDHLTGQLVPEWTYLSGDVRTKHAQVCELVDQGRTEFTANRDALQAVLPRWVSLSDITVRPGVPWIPAQDLHAFAEQELGVTMDVRFDTHEQSWVLDEAVAKGLFDPMVQLKYGTRQKSVKDLWLATLNNKSVTVTKEVETADGRTTRRTDPQATRAAREKVEALNEGFATWLTTQPERAEALEASYNRQFNSYRPADYTQAGQALVLEGLSEAITPHEYQRSAVARALNEPTVLLDHVVGAGKTGSMIMSAMELRRSGVARKPWVVVPNHLVEQTAAEWATWYPGANVMTIPTGSDKRARARYVAASAAGDWDAVIVPQSVFERIGIDRSRARQWAAEEIADLRANTEARTEQQTKKVERQVKAIENRFDDYLSKRDAGLPFESTGCDYLIVDEAHHFKNLARVSDYPELACSPGSKRAWDLDFKLRALREAKLEAAQRAGLDTTSYRPAVAMFATGTPVANQLSEMWVMQRYLQPEVLDELGLNTVDSWARTFTTSSTKMEIGPDGSTWRLKDRVNRIVNAPELIGLVGRFTDRVDQSMVTAQLPELHGGQRQVMTEPAAEEVAQYVQDLAHRANNLPEDPAEDNLLKISHEGRMIALDPRTLGLPALADGGRVQQVAEAVMSIHQENEHNVYTDATGAPSPIPGGFQLVFCDRSTPQDDGSFSVYQALADELVSLGMAREKIAFIHDADDDEARAELFSKCRTGEINVLVGSTEKMGTGVNVQTRAVALHHMDCPWRPSDLEQREGRIIRQGNQNPKVHIRQYVTEGTYDAVMWQIVANKAAFIAQTKADSGHRHLTDPQDDMTISAAAASAIATGDPRIMERAELIERVQGLETLRNAHYSQVSHARSQLLTATARIDTLHTSINELQQMSSQANGQGYLSPAGRAGNSRPETGELVIAAINSRVKELTSGASPQIGTLDGIPLFAHLDRDLRNQRQFSLHLGSGQSIVATYPEGDPSTWSPVGIATRLDNLLPAITTHIDRLTGELSAIEERLPQWQHVTDSTFAHTKELATMQHRLDEIDEALALSEDSNTITAAESRDLIPGAELANIAPGIDTDGKLETGYRRDVPDILRTGDVIIGLEGASTVLYEVEIQVPDPAAPSEQPPADHNRRQALIRPADDPEAPWQAVGRWEDKLRLVSRRESALSQAEQWALEHNMTLHEVWGYRRNSGIDFGAIMRADGTFTLGRIYSVTTDSQQQSTVTISPTTDPDPDQSFAGTPRRDLPLEEGDLLVRIQPGQAASIYNPNTEPRQGAVTTEDITTPNGTTLPAGSILTNTGYSVSLLDPATGNRVEFANRDLLNGRLLPPEDAPIEHFTKWGLGATTVADLRSGDTLTSRDLDPKAKITEQVRVLSTFNTGKRTEITYAPINGGPRASLTRAAHHQVNIQTRSIGSLDPLERVLLTTPGAQLTTVDELRPGDCAVVHDWREPYTATYTGTVPANYPGAPELHGFDLGQNRTAKANRATPVIKLPQNTDADLNTWPTIEHLHADPYPPERGRDTPDPTSPTPATSPAPAPSTQAPTASL